MMEVFDQSLQDLARQVAEKKERILEEVASAGFDPRIVKFDVEYRTEERDNRVFLSAIIIPRFLPACGVAVMP